MSAVVWEQGIAASPADASGRLPMVRGDGDAVIAFGPDGSITRATFLAHVRGVAALLPDAPFALNLCEDRYRFLVAFCAVALRGHARVVILDA